MNLILPKLTVLLYFFLFFNTILAQDNFLQTNNPPAIPVGDDAYLMWEKLPYQRIGTRTYMRSTYDREGNNRTADASHFLYQESDSFNVTLDVKGTGILYFMRTNHFHGSPWHYDVDGEDFIVKETATDDPVNAKKKFTKTEFIPQELFPHPLTWTWSDTKGADLMWVPISFENSFRLAYSRTLYGTGYYIYQQFPMGFRNTTKPLQTWSKKAPLKEVTGLIDKAGTDIAPNGGETKSYSGKLSIGSDQWMTICDIKETNKVIRAVKFKIAREQAEQFGEGRIRITWDDRLHPSVDAPISLFFGTGKIYNNNNREFLVKGLLMNIRYDPEFVYLACYYPMPFFKRAKIEIFSGSEAKLNDLSWEISTLPLKDPINQVTYFHATYTDHPRPRPGEDNIFLDTKQVEGGGLWSGHFAGMSWIFTRTGDLTTLEGDPRFFFDNSKTPQAWGTGTEEWGGGGDYWGGENMTIPLAGHPIGSRADKAKSEKDLLNSAYRFLIADIFPFGQRAVIGLEHGGLNSHPEHYSGVVYWYGVNDASLVLTDELNVCNTEDIEKHNYTSPSAEPPYELVSRYEWGPDHDIAGWSNPKGSDSIHYGARMYFPAEADSVSIMKGETRFTVSLIPENLGVLLRRKFDYAYPNQNACVYIKNATSSEWQFVGNWYTAGSNTCVYSRPEGGSFTEREFAPTEHHIITSNRRWREEEFLIDRQFTIGIKKLDIKIEWVKNEKPLFPGQPFPFESAWSESRYYVFCYKMPKIHF